MRRRRNDRKVSDFSWKENLVRDEGWPSPSNSALNVFGLAVRFSFSFWRKVWRRMGGEVFISSAWRMLESTVRIECTFDPECNTWRIIIKPHWVSFVFSDCEFCEMKNAPLERQKKLMSFHEEAYRINRRIENLFELLRTSSSSASYREELASRIQMQKFFETDSCACGVGEEKLLNRRSLCMQKVA